MRAVTPQRTALTRCEAPTPMIADEITCVVDTGAPNDAAVNNVAAAAVRRPVGG